MERRETDGIMDNYPNRRQRLGLEPYEPVPVVQDTREELDWSTAAFAVLWSAICVAAGAFIGLALRGWWGMETGGAK